MDSLEKTTHEWFRLGEVYYRKFLMSKFIEPYKRLTFNSCHIAVARNGGMIAFVKKTKHFIIDVNNPIKDSILVYYQNAHRDSDFIKFENKENIILFEFTAEEDLICLLASGKLYTFDIFLLNYDFEFMGITFEDNPIVDARLIDRSLYMLTENGDIYYCHNYKEPSSIVYFSIKKIIQDYPYVNYVSSCCTSVLKKEYNPNSASMKSAEIYYPSEFIIIPASKSSSGRNELILPHPKHGLIIYVENDSTVKYMKDSRQVALTKQCGIDLYSDKDLGKIMKLMISPDNSYVAFFNTDGKVFVMPSTLKEDEVSVSVTKDLTIVSPFQMLWCSEDCIICLSGNTITLIGPEDQTRKLTTKSNSYLVSEIDGIRVIQDDQIEFIQRVSNELVDSIFPLSFDPSKKLLEAYKVYYFNITFDS